MKKFVIATAALLASSSAALAQAEGDAGRGQQYWTSPLHQCRNCHGPQGEGQFGPDLAGRGLNGAQVYRAAHQPWGIMPAFVETQINQQQAADLAAFFATMPKRPAPAKWRFEATADMPAGQAMLINMGCGQCHSPNFQGPRGNLGAVNADFEYFANLVYNHTTATPVHRAALGVNAANGANLDMGNFSRTRLSEADLRQIYDWARNQIGFRPFLQARLGRPTQGANGVTYPLTVANGGMAGKGISAEGVTVELQIPDGTTVMAATGAGYQGVKGNKAVWAIPSLAAKEQQNYTITLSKAASGIKGDVHWSKPTPSPEDVVNVAVPAGA
ncbi:MAG: cytochrome c [Alphaproteobacteria bacterium]|nr:cytochrome c [Alphaproteobacteria bacterium]